MKKKGLLHIGALFIGLTIASSASAKTFSVTGKIKKIIVHDNAYSGCMIYIDQNLEDSCRSRWVSLDCKGLFNGKDKEIGKQKLATAIAAAHNNKTVQLSVNSSQKVNGYCVAKRIDTFF